MNRAVKRMVCLVLAPARESGMVYLTAWSMRASITVVSLGWLVTQADRVEGCRVSGFRAPIMEMRFAPKWMHCLSRNPPDMPVPSMLGTAAGISSPGVVTRAALSLRALRRLS